jgi:hypothetical protein
MSTTKKFDVYLTEEEEKTLMYDVGDISKWLSMLVDNKLQQCEKLIVEDKTDKQPNKLSRLERKKLIKNNGDYENRNKKKRNRR